MQALKSIVRIIISKKHLYRPDFFAATMIVSLALLGSGCRGRKSVLYTGDPDKTQRSSSNDGYREVTLADDLSCGYETSQLISEYVFDSDNRIKLINSGQLVRLYCSTANGPNTDLELASLQLDKGKIQTKQFGTVRTDGGFPGDQNLRFYMNEDQISRIRAFLKSRN